MRRSLRRSDIAEIARLWADLIEGHPDAPLALIRFTPAGLLAFMERNGVDVIDVEWEPGPAPYDPRRRLIEVPS